MEKSTQALRERTALTELIRNIRTVRHQVRSAKVFDADLFNKINGTDGALESLVGHTTLVEAMTIPEVHELRREIMNKLNAEEIKAFDALRTSLKSYFSGLTQAIAAYKVEEHVALSDAFNTDKAKQVVKLAIDTGKIDSGLYSVEALKSTLFAYSKAIDFITAITPVMARIRDEQDDGEIPEAIPNEGTEEGSTAAEPEKVQEEQNNNVLPEESTVIVDPAKENDNALVEIKVAAAANRSMAMCLDKFNGGGNPKSLGYVTMESMVQAINDIVDTENAYMKALKDFSEIVPATTCVADDLCKGSIKFYDTFDVLMDLVSKCEDVRVNLDQTKTTLKNVISVVEEAV